MCSLLVIVVLAFSCTGAAWAKQDRADSKLLELVTHGSYLVHSDRGTISYRQNDLFLPASTLKILTSLAAFDLLGADFRFETHFFCDKKDNLYIKGYGDPFLTSEEILSICSSLKKRGISKIGSIFLDTSIFSLQQQTPGTDNSSNPYDAPNGSLAANFNTIAITQLIDGTIQSGEPQTPTLPIMKRLGSNFPRNNQRINIARSTTESLLPIPLQYFGELFCAQLYQVGISVKDGFQIKDVPPSLEPFLIHKNSKTLQEVMGACLRYSNNFIANQVFLYIGLQAGGPPATWEKGKIAISNYLRKTLGLSAQQITVYDGSGLSRKNRMSTKSLVTILQHFKPYSSLLNKRPGVLLKSGTMHGVYCYAGYMTNHGPPTPFAILLNQAENTRNELLKRLRAINAPSTRLPTGVNMKSCQ